MLELMMTILMTIMLSMIASLTDTTRLHDTIASMPSTLLANRQMRALPCGVVMSDSLFHSCFSESTPALPRRSPWTTNAESIQAMQIRRSLRPTDHSGNLSADIAALLQFHLTVTLELTHHLRSAAQPTVNLLLVLAAQPAKPGLSKTSLLPNTHMRSLRLS
ncbi:unnamed protein product [Oikopleura dioica]|uniref:Secreted protein n=1 Tax=Oikopleura dioica TaxID=34765 RepID=E4YXT5_OIKDI|nr:unnamed protein product [Oikopleura dioica]